MAECAGRGKGARVQGAVRGGVPMFTTPVRQCNRKFASAATEKVADPLVVHKSLSARFNMRACNATAFLTRVF